MIRKNSFLILITLVILSACVPATQPEPRKFPEPQPPTEMPTYTPELVYEQPVFVPISDQIIAPGSAGTEIDLSRYVFYVDFETDVATWRAESSEELSISMKGPLMQIQRASDDWLENQTVRVEVCNPGNLCGQVEIDVRLIGSVENGIMQTQNDGVIIEVDGVKVMIDALFLDPNGTPQTMIDAMRSAAPPYDGADIILATHHHLDHFDADIMVDHLLNNPEGWFISTDAAVELMARDEDYDLVRDRVTGFHLENGDSTTLTISGVDLEIMFFSHGMEEVPNFGYLFNLGERTFFHIGDIVFDSEPVETLLGFGLPEKGIDYAFVPYFMLTSPTNFPYATDGINAKYLVPVHVSTQSKRTGGTLATVEQNFDNAILFSQDYAWYSLPEGE
jgi:L-ascorbate metabolism protein UlaG (beta-lactamase superfamily)